MFQPPLRTHSLDGRCLRRALRPYRSHWGATRIASTATPDEQDGTHGSCAAEIVEWATAAELPLCVLAAAMRNRRILDATMASVGARIRPAIETGHGLLPLCIRVGGGAQERSVQFGEQPAELVLVLFAERGQYPSFRLPYSGIDAVQQRSAITRQLGWQGPARGDGRRPSDETALL